MGVTLTSHKRRRLDRRGFALTFLLGAIAGGAFDNVVGQFADAVLGVSNIHWGLVLVLLILFITICFAAYHISARIMSTILIYEIRFPKETIQVLIDGTLARCQKGSTLHDSLERYKAWAEDEYWFNSAKIDEMRRFASELKEKADGVTDQVVVANLAKLYQYPTTLGQCHTDIISAIRQSNVFHEIDWTSKEVEDGIEVLGPRSWGRSPTYIRISLSLNKTKKLSVPILCEVTFLADLPAEQYDVAMMSVDNLFVEVFGANEMGLKPVLSDDEKFWERMHKDVTQTVSSKVDGIGRELPGIETVKVVVKEALQEFKLSRKAT